MIRRLLMALLIACLALPAAAMPVGHRHGEVAQAPQAMAGHHHHAPAPEQDRRSTAASPHDCIGCIAPYASIGAVAPLGLFPEARQRPALEDALLAIPTGPETPPPRA